MKTNSFVPLPQPYTSKSSGCTSHSSTAEAVDEEPSEPGAELELAHREKEEGVELLELAEESSRLL